MQRFGTFVLVFLGFFAPAQVYAQSSIATYGGFWSGLPVGTVTLIHTQVDGSYSFSMTLESGGILGSRFTTTFVADGQVDGIEVSPTRARFIDSRRGETRTETISYDRRGLPSFSSTPAYIVPPEFEFDIERARGSLDPTSGLFALLNAAALGECEQRFIVYDGFSLFSAQITDEGMVRVNNDVYEGQAQKCRLRLTPIAGKAAVFGSFTIPEMEVAAAVVSPNTPAIPVHGALFINGDRAGLRFRTFEAR